MSPPPLTSILEKIVPRSKIEALAAQWKHEGKHLVFTNGCFDLIHPGHIHLLSEAKALGDHLIIGLNTDRSVSKLKGPKRPINKEDDRALQLAALQLVDAVVLFDEDTPLELIQQIIPSVLVKGGDYEPREVVGKSTVEEQGGSVVIVPLKEGYSTSQLIERLKH